MGGRCGGVGVEVERSDGFPFAVQRRGEDAVDAALVGGDGYVGPQPAHLRQVDLHESVGAGGVEARPRPGLVLGLVDDVYAGVGGSKGERRVAGELDGHAGVVGAVDVLDRQRRRAGHQLDYVVAAENREGQCGVDLCRQVGVGGGER